LRLRRLAHVLRPRQPTRRPRESLCPRRIAPQLRYLTGSAQVWHATNRTQSTHVDRSEPRRLPRVTCRRACAPRPSCPAPDGNAPRDRRSAR
jgi:hypothetical protein